MSDKGRPLPKFGEWDVNNPASAEGFSAIFNKARDERRTGNAQDTEFSANKDEIALKHGHYTAKSSSKKWFCCMQASAEA